MLIIENCMHWIKKKKKKAREVDRFCTSRSNGTNNEKVKLEAKSFELEKIKEREREWKAWSAKTDRSVASAHGCFHFYRAKNHPSSSTVKTIANNTAHTTPNQKAKINFRVAYLFSHQSRGRSRRSLQRRRWTDFLDLRPIFVFRVLPRASVRSSPNFLRVRKNKMNFERKILRSSL